MGVVDDALFEMKLVVDRVTRGLFRGRDDKDEKKGKRFCPACGQSNPGSADKCSKCYRSFTLYNK